MAMGTEGGASVGAWGDGAQSTAGKAYANAATPVRKQLRKATMAAESRKESRGTL